MASETALSEAATHSAMQSLINQHMLTHTNMCMCVCTYVGTYIRTTLDHHIGGLLLQCLSAQTALRVTQKSQHTPTHHFRPVMYYIDIFNTHKQQLHTANQWPSKVGALHRKHTRLADHAQAHTQWNKLPTNMSVSQKMSNTPTLPRSSSQLFGEIRCIHVHAHLHAQQ